MSVVLMASLAAKQVPARAVGSLHELGCELRWDSFSTTSPQAELAAALRDMDAVLAGNEVYTAEVLSGATRLRVISRTGVGYDSVDVEAATKQGIAVCTAAGSNDEAVADYAVALMLAVSRQIPAGHSALSAGRWERFMGPAFHGSTVGIIGLGTIGKKLARRLRGFNVAILAYDVQQDEAFAREMAVSYVPLDELLATSDFISIHAPLFPPTRGLIGERELRLMNSTAFLVNTARGPLIQEAALHRALKERWIAGAGIDVFEREPALDSPLLDPTLDNIVRTPHLAGSTFEAYERMVTMACESIAHLLGGTAPLHHVLNPRVLQTRPRS
ncbi:MAG: phosphoglycerate dehydrogenase [Chloroflexi bacterium]|nr:phosphoglycerate dehydrogenase [Chloroflexota bacterium]